MRIIFINFEWKSSWRKRLQMCNFGIISTIRAGLLPLTVKLCCSLFIYFSYKVLTSSLFTFRYKHEWLGKSRRHHDEGPLLFILSWLQITFDLDSTKTDVTPALSAASFDQIYGAKSTAWRIWPLSTICFSDTFYPNKSCLTPNSLTSNNHNLHGIS